MIGIYKITSPSILINCCAEISSINGKLKGKEPADLYKWIEENL